LLRQKHTFNYVFNKKLELLSKYEDIIKNEFENLFLPILIYYNIDKHEENSFENFNNRNNDKTIDLAMAKVMAKDLNSVIIRVVNTIYRTKAMNNPMFKDMDNDVFKVMNKIKEKIIDNDISMAMDLENIMAKITMANLMNVDMPIAMNRILDLDINTVNTELMDVIDKYYISNITDKKQIYKQFIKTFLEYNFRSEHRMKYKVILAIGLLPLAKNDTENDDIHKVIKKV